MKNAKDSHVVHRPQSDRSVTSPLHGPDSAPLAKPTDGWDALRPKFARPFDVPELSARPSDAPLVNEAYRSIPAVPTDAWMRYKGPVPIGIPIELPPNISDEQADLMMIHAWALLYKQIVCDSGLPIVLSGRWGLPTSDQAAFVVWLDAGPTRLVILPMLRRYGRTISVGVAHSVLCLQGWMTSHDPDNVAHWADLSSRYEYYFKQPGRAYYEYSEAYDDGYIYWHRVRSWMDKLICAVGGRRAGWGDGEILFTTREYPGNTVFFSEQFKSFFHFGVGDAAVPEGSQPGVLLSQVCTSIAKSTMQWRTGLAPQQEMDLELPQRFGIGTAVREEN